VSGPSTVNVVIAAYNDARWLPETLESVLASSGLSGSEGLKPWEILSSAYWNF